MRLIACIILAVSLTGYMSGVAIAESRVALVIGNSKYEHASDLDNPKHDAEDIANALQGLGFDVFQGTDLTLAGFDQILRKFSRALSSADVALLFYAGHGAQVAGTNYLIPVDGRFDTVDDITDRAISLRQIREVMERRPRINLLFFDACRDNPFLVELSRSANGVSRKLRQGWADMAPSHGTYISFASAKGEVASDGEGRNSPFTKALLEHIEKPNTDVVDMMKTVRLDVINATKGSQVPWEHSSMTSRFVFAQSASRSQKSFITSAKTQYREGEKIKLYITPPEDCRLTLLNVDNKGKSCILFPHPKLPDTVLKAGQRTVFPPKGSLTLGEVGEETFVAMCNASDDAKNAEARHTRPIDCSKGAADRSFNDHVLETVTFDLDDESESKPSASNTASPKQIVLRSSLTVTVSP